MSLYRRDRQVFVRKNDLKLIERSAFSHFNLRISRLIEENASQLLLAQSLNFFCKEKSMFKVMNNVGHMTKFLLFATTHIYIKKITISDIKI